IRSSSVTNEGLLASSWRRAPVVFCSSAHGFRIAAQASPSIALQRASPAWLQVQRRSKASSSCCDSAAGNFARTSLAGPYTSTAGAWSSVLGAESLGGNRQAPRLPRLTDGGQRRHDLVRRHVRVMPPPLRSRFSYEIAHGHDSDNAMFGVDD